MNRHKKLARDMLAGQFQPGTFSHGDHIGTAFELLQMTDFLTAAATFGLALKNYATTLGAPEKFNTTITLAFLALIADRNDAYTDSEQFLQHNPDLLDHGVLSRWYTDDELGTRAAREFFLMPDVG